jgi:hypothetical protein
MEEAFVEFGDRLRLLLGLVFAEEEAGEFFVYH